ncbi:MAG: leucine-rich repeat protein [Candidatus Methanomethylophilaceae archaeon]|nr:leucine-rich repeat protein [Candidatus Methanomethylophilaceae archaeon]
MCSSLSTVTLGKGLGAVSEECFGHCVCLTDMELSQSVASVGDRTFYRCSGHQYIDPKNVSEVGKDVFT